MGNSASFVSLESISKKDIAQYVKEFVRLEECAEILLFNEVDGARLASIKQDDLLDYLSGIGIEIEEEQQILLEELTKLKAAFSPPAGSSEIEETSSAVEELIEQKSEFEQAMIDGMTLSDFIAKGWKIDTEENWKLLYDTGSYSLLELKQAGCKGFFLRHIGAGIDELKQVSKYFSF